MKGVTYGNVTVSVQAEAEDDGILLLNDRYAPNWGVVVNGKPAELLRCNGIMRGVQVPKGHVDVRFEYRRPYLVPTLVKAGTLALVLLWGLVYGLVRWVRRARA